MEEDGLFLEMQNEKRMLRRLESNTSLMEAVESAESASMCSITVAEQIEHLTRKQQKMDRIMSVSLNILKAAVGVLTLGVFVFILLYILIMFESM